MSIPICTTQFQRSPSKSSHHKIWLAPTFQAKEKPVPCHIISALHPPDQKNDHWHLMKLTQKQKSQDRSLLFAKYPDYSFQKVAGYLHNSTSSESVERRLLTSPKPQTPPVRSPILTSLVFTAISQMQASLINSLLIYCLFTPIKLLPLLVSFLSL